MIVADDRRMIYDDGIVWYSYYDECMIVAVIYLSHRRCMIAAWLGLQFTQLSVYIYIYT